MEVTRASACRAPNITNQVVPPCTGAHEVHTSTNSPGTGPWPPSERMRRYKVGGCASTASAISRTVIARSEAPRTSGMRSFTATNIACRAMTRTGIRPQPLCMLHSAECMGTSRTMEQIPAGLHWTAYLREPVARDRQHHGRCQGVPQHGEAVYQVNRPVGAVPPRLSAHIRSCSRPCGVLIATRSATSAGAGCRESGRVPGRWELDPRTARCGCTVRAAGGRRRRLRSTRPR